jgi:hypothetical protein
VESRFQQQAILRPRLPTRRPRGPRWTVTGRDKQQAPLRPELRVWWVGGGAGRMGMSG